MAEWVNRTLGELAAQGRSVISGPFGSDIGTKFFKSEGVPVIRGNNLSTDNRKFIDDGFVFVTEEKADNLNAYAVENDLLFTAAGTIGQVGLIPKGARFDKYVISNKQIRFRVDTDKIDLDYLYAWLSSPWTFKSIINRNTGSTVPLINLSVVRSLAVSFPKDVSTQRKIGRFFGSLDAKIDLNNRINAELEALAKTIYDYWFVQFEFPDASGRPYKTSGGKMVWNELLKRDIPAGWEAVPLRHLVEEIKDGVAPNVSDSTTPYVGLEHIARRSIVISSWATADKATSNKIAFRKGDILFGKIRPYFHKIALAMMDGIASTDAIVMRPRQDDFAALALENIFSDRFVEAATASSTGSKMPRADWSVMRNFSIAIPSKPSAIVRDYQRIFDRIRGKLENNAKQNRELTHLRDWLLPLLMNGQVRVA